MTIPQLITMFLEWLKTVPFVSTLLIIIGLDIFGGLLVAFVKRTVNSTISYRGMVRKVFTLLLVGVAVTLEPFAQGMPLGQLAALSFIITNTISILENAAVLGVPIPRVIVDALLKLKDDQKQRLEQKLPTVHVDVQPTQTVLVHTEKVDGDDTPR